MKQTRKKRFGVLLLVLAMVCSLFMGLPDYVAAAEGDGQNTDVIEIGTAEELIALGERDFAEISDKKIVLTADIDMAGQEAIAPIGGSTAFNGILDGQDHVIRNLTIVGEKLCSGLFGYVGTEGKIMNLGLDRVNVSGTYNVGTFAGAMTGSVTECYATGTINGNKYVGGIAGMLHAGTIENCWTDVVVTGKNYVGGLFGGSDFNTRSTNAISPVAARITDKSMVVRNNLTLGKVTATTNFAGGILGDVGNSKASPTAAFEGNVVWTDLVKTGGTYYDPIYGWFSGGHKLPKINVNNLYYDGVKLIGSADSITQANCATHDELKVVSATKEQLGVQSTYEGLSWNFTDTWVWSTELGHPVLKGFAVPEDFVPGEQKTPASLVTTYADDPKTTRAFIWYTDISVKKTLVQAVPKAEYSSEADFAGANVLVAEGTVYALETSAEGDFRNIHKVNLTGLTAGTDYCYRVGDGKYWSGVYTFTTEREDADSFTFFSMTDTQNAYSNYANVLKYATEAYPEAEFILHGGDVIQENSSADYDEVFELTKAYVTDLPTMVTPGNHELAKDTSADGKFVPDYVKGIDNYKSHYQFPENGPEGGDQVIYSFDYGDAHFIVLNTNTKGYPSKSAMVEWMKEDLADNDKAWVIVSMHHGAFNSYATQDKTLSQAMFDLGVDLVLFGHNHVLLRSNPITLDGTDVIVGTSEQDENGVYHAEAEGTVYYSSGCAGGTAGSSEAASKYYQLYTNASKDSTYGAITVTEDTITIYTHSVPNKHKDKDSMLLDTFVLHKPAAETVTVVAAEDLVYNGDAQELVLAAASEEGIVVYSLDGENYSAELPEGVDAGTYTVWYKVVGDKEHSDSEGKSLTVTIAKKDITNAVITLGEELIYSGSEQTQTIESVVVDGLTVTYEVSGNTGTNVGDDYVLTVTGTGNFTGNAAIGWEIQEKIEVLPDTEGPSGTEGSEREPETEEEETLDPDDSPDAGNFSGNLIGGIYSGFLSVALIAVLVVYRRISCKRR